MKIMQSGKIEPKKLITHCFSLDRIVDAYETLSRAASTQALKVIVETAAAQTLPARAAEEPGTAVSSGAADVWSCDLVTRTGLVLHVRPVRPEDETLLAEFFAHVTPADLRFRFLGGVREVSRERLAAMTRVDHRTTEHFLALADDHKAIVATAMVACCPSMTKTEVAISVRAGDKRPIRRRSGSFSHCARPSDCCRRSPPPSRAPVARVRRSCGRAVSRGGPPDDLRPLWRQERLRAEVRKRRHPGRDNVQAPSPIAFPPQNDSRSTRAYLRSCSWSRWRQ